MSFNPGYDAGPAYGTPGPAVPFQDSGDIGAPGFGGADLLPAYYAPLSAEYAPILPAPAANIVW